jgi:DGQHR domain-containing protein
MQPVAAFETGELLKELIAMSNTLIPALTDINIPPHVQVVNAANIEELFTEAGKRSMMGYAGNVFFGTAFIQGARLQFTTAMPVAKMVEVSKVDRSRKKASVLEAMEHSNRPQEPAHAKAVRDYLLSTACTGDKFILPAFTFNYGVDLDAESPVATLILFGASTEGTNTWPGVLCLPPGAMLDTTDGAHRRGQIEEILNNAQSGSLKQDALKQNAVDVKIVFEENRSDSHQDFADCGKAKSIAKSLITTFDVRDERNRRSRELVANTPFLKAYVDATASNVNLSAKSRKIWSMSAVRMFVAHIAEHHPDREMPLEEKTKEVEAFVTALSTHLPQLAALSKVRNEKDPEVTAGQFREKRGGDIALRGVGMAIFARAYLHCREHNVEFDEMAAQLATIDWNLLNVERDELPKEPTLYAGAVQKAVLPTWAHLLAVGETGYRIRSSSEDAERAWEKIRAHLFDYEHEKAA